MDIGLWLDRNGIAHRVTATNKRDALGAAAEIAARSFGLDSRAVLEALLAREANGSTGVGHGVALPHARVSGLNRMRGIFLRFETPIDFAAVDEQPVDLMFVLLAPGDAGSEHLRALARVSRLLRQPDLRRQLRQARSPDAVYALLVREASTHAA
jgi:PTS system nitrogen regulatory IIA component